MQKQGQLQFSYRDYEEDFDAESPKRNDFNGQTTPPNLSNVSKKQNTKPNEKNQPKQEKQIKSPVQNQGATRQKMIQQNIKLKTQIYQLAKQMDEIMTKEKKQKKFGIHADQEEDETIKSKKLELKKQQIQIMQLKNKIFMTKRQLEHVYDNRGIQGKEDQLKALQKQLRGLQQQKDALLKVKKQQTKALKMIRNDHEYEEKIKNLKEQLSKIKDECKSLSQKLIQNERVLRKNHQQYITRQSRIKQMQLKIKQNKQKAKKGSQQNVVTIEMITQIEDQINQLEGQRKQSQKTWNDKIRNIESELQQRRMQQQKKLLILKQKEKQLKLNEIRIKQLKKLIQHQHSQNLQKKIGSNEPDMKEYRHKRNIKYLQK